MKKLVFKNGVTKDLNLNFGINRVTIYDDEPNVSGFIVAGDDEDSILRDASKFTTLYKAYEGYYVLSDNGEMALPDPTPEEIATMEEERARREAEEAERRRIWEEEEAERQRLAAEEAARLALIPTNEELADAIAELAAMIGGEI